MSKGWLFRLSQHTHLWEGKEVKLTSGLHQIKIVWKVRKYFALWETTEWHDWTILRKQILSISLQAREAKERNKNKTLTWVKQTLDCRAWSKQELLFPNSLFIITVTLFLPLSPPSVGLYGCKSNKIWPWSTWEKKKEKIYSLTSYGVTCRIIGKPNRASRIWKQEQENSRHLNSDC